ncbi:carboxy terminal-processing peptidase [Membranihabitans maritimus]|uniref:carboxy terminal-processing peptidase n=1 Tax=Membranihabitans maritimus TaxID=2904244 RepID=UPI001F39B1E3|nr:carboxy terminal-processing peptidase [Membranihabitans maritimus]
MVLRGIVLVAVLGSGLFINKMSDSSLDDLTREQVIVKGITTFVDYLHYSPHEMNDEFSNEVYENYMSSLDSRKQFFLQSEVDQLKKHRNSIDEEVKESKLDFFDESYELYVQAFERTKGYYEEILKEPFDLSVDEVVEMDADKMNFASSEEELKDYWRKLLKYETVNRVLDKKNARLKGDEELTLEELEKEAREGTKRMYDRWFDNQDDLRKADFFDQYMNAVTGANDPHSNYFSPKKKEDFEIDMSGKLEGIGARLTKDGEFTKVVSVVPGGPAWKGKELEENDLIAKVAQGEEEPVDVRGWRTDDVVQLIRGEAGTKVRLVVKKPDGVMKEIAIIRDEVEIGQSFAKSFLIEDNKLDKKIGYVKLPRFYFEFDGDRRSSKDMAEELEKLKKQNVEGIILDLRYNPGGSLSDVVDISGLFIGEGPVVQVKSRDDDPHIWKDKDEKVRYDGPLVILVNQFSASASEILAAAMQDYGRAVIVGSNSTFGKGTVQRFFHLDQAFRGNSPYDDLGDVKLTIQKYYRINGGSVQLKGVVPDIILPDAYSYMEMGEKEYENPLDWTKIDPLEYDQKVFKVDNMEEIKVLSRKRVEQSEVFGLVDENAMRMKNMRDESNYPLQLEAFEKMEDKRKKESEKYKDIFPVNEELDVANLPEDMDKIQIDSSIISSNKSEIINIKKDIYINEALNIVNDLIETHSLTSVAGERDAINLKEN